MPIRIATAAVVGLDPLPVDVEADISRALPAFAVVGLPDIAVQEARERVRAAIRNSGLPFPQTKVTVNLAPANLRKEGPGYDLPIAMSVLVAAQAIEDGPQVRDALFYGELALDGSLRSVNGVLSIALLAAATGKVLYVPETNACEAALVPHAKVIGVKNLSELVAHLKGQGGSSLSFAEHVVPELSKVTHDDVIDFAAIRGQEHAKRALEIAAAGGHNILLSGPPGSGKTLLARGLASILPEMVLEESLEVTRIYSVAGRLPSSSPLILKRPFRSPHHSASAIALVGGGAWPSPGEVSLAHRGVLFLDEFPEFGRAVLEHLRQPMEDGVVTISRASGSIQFPARFMLVASQNPCPCGYASDPERNCTCSLRALLKYQQRISGPILDRIDLQIEVPRVPFEKLHMPAVGETSAQVRVRVESARHKQRERYATRNIINNAEMSSKDVERHCMLDEKMTQLMRQAVAKFQLSARSYYRVLKVARTIADLDGVEELTLVHLTEALQYRLKATALPL